MYRYFKEDATEKDFLDYLEKIDWRLGDIFINVEDEKNIANLKKNLLPEEQYLELKKHIETLSNYLQSNNLHYRNSERHFRNFKYCVFDRFEETKRAIESLEKEDKEVSGIIVTKFVYTPAVPVSPQTTKGWYSYSHGFSSPAKMEIYLENLSAKTPYKIELSRWSNFRQSEWKRLNKRKRGEGKKSNVSENS